jgi:hypothetical protein
MTHNPWQRLLCLLGRHKRSHRYMIEHFDYYESVCRHCRTPMVKSGGKWRAGGRSRKKGGAASR